MDACITIFNEAIYIIYTLQPNHYIVQMLNKCATQVEMATANVLKGPNP